MLVVKEEGEEDANSKSNQRQCNSHQTRDGGPLRKDQSKEHNQYS